ncbi:MAG: Adenylate cyclase [Rhodanobacteraceae bacterium]|jgi:serine/threonine-protein kinase|nr:MAG: Adenylate cyclase [Rhodanobacteraceae bacterium]
MPATGFLQDLRRHHVFRVAATYAVVAWLIIQIIAVIFPLLQFPAWLARTLVVLVLAGFPFALVLAWAFQAPGDAQRVTTSSRRRSLRIGFSLGAVGVLVAALGGVVWWYFGPIEHTLRGADDGAASAPVALNPKSIAVLPLSVLGDPGQSYLGQGISEELLNALSRVPGLEVIGRTSSFRFRGNDLDAKAIGRELGARNLLYGVVQRSGDQLRIDVELDDSVTGVVLWSQQYNEKMESLFALEDTISNAVVAALQVKLGGIDSGKLVFKGTTSPQAHDLYLQGSRLSWHTDEASLDEALVLFNQAIAIDPNYAAAWAGMARAYIYLADVYRAPLSILPAMRGAAEKAVALNPDLAEGHLQLGYIAMSYDLDFAKAKREIELALKLRPSLAEAHALMGFYVLRIGKDAAAARKDLQAAEKLDPLNPWYPRWEAYAAIAQGNEADAMKLAQRVNQIDPSFAYNGDAVAMVDGAFGHWQACVDRYTQQHAKLSTSSPQLAICQAHTGDTAQARATLQTLLADAQHHYVDRTYIAAIDAALDDKDAAMAQLEQAYRDRSAHMNSLWLNPWYRPLHGDPRFETLTARIAAGESAQHPAASASALK